VRERWLQVEGATGQGSPFRAAARFVRQDSAQTGPESWRCVETAPILRRHLLGATGDEARETLIRLGWTWTWLPASGPASPQGGPILSPAELVRETFRHLGWDEREWRRRCGPGADAVRDLLDGGPLTERCAAALVRALRHGSVEGWTGIAAEYEASRAETADSL
jgi:hypothetical protein